MADHMTAEQLRGVIESVAAFMDSNAKTNSDDLPATEFDRDMKLAAAHLREAVARLSGMAAVPDRDAIAGLVEGMSVSVDVSTCDDSAGHRYFGTVTEAMHDPDDKHGLTLLVQDAEPNFKPSKSYEWSKGAFDDGAQARIDGRSRLQVPPAAVIGDYSYRSWLAGWNSADTDLLANPQEFDAAPEPPHV